MLNAGNVCKVIDRAPSLTRIDIKAEALAALMVDSEARGYFRGLR